ncbi:MAG: hypothetical protein R2867_23490 [Caldilineaceae bacterium]
MRNLRAIVAICDWGGSADQNRKQDWQAAIATAWSIRNSRRASQATFARGPETPHRLLAGGSDAGFPLWAEYGAIRLPGVARRPVTDGGAADRCWTNVQVIAGDAPMAEADYIAYLPDDALPPPWRQPATVAEELFYSALLFPEEPGSIRQARRIGIPADLSANLVVLRYFVADDLFAAYEFRAEEDRTSPLPIPDQPPVLLHDLAQYLIYLYTEPQLTLQHGRWLAPRQLQQLNRRLLHPARAPIRSHKHDRYLAFLAFLAAATELQQAGQVTSAGYHWLQATPVEQLRLLWDSWRQSTVALRQAYGTFAAQLPPLWFVHTLDFLAEGFFAPSWLSAVILHIEADAQAMYVAHLADLHSLDCQHMQLLALLAHWFEAVQPASTTMLPEQHDDALVARAAGCPVIL